MIGKILSDPLLLMIITMILLYIIGVVTMLRSIIKYKYSLWWLIIGFILLPFPPLVFIFCSYREKVVLKKSEQIKERTLSEIKFKGIMVLFLIHYILGVLLTFFFQYGYYVKWGGELAYSFVNIMFLFFVFAYVVYGKKQIKKLLNMQEML